MLNFLFPRLTADHTRGSLAFSAVTAMARNPAYFRDCEVPDTLDGRFAMVATMTALALIRIERGGERSGALAAALTERFVEAMDAEHRELGMSDPTIGKTVRKLVALLERRVDLWRSTVDGKGSWEESARSSLHSGTDGVAWGAAGELLRADWERLRATDIADLELGDIA